MELEDGPLGVVTTLRSTLAATLSTVLSQPASPVREYAATLHVRWSPDDGPEVDRAVLSELSGVDVEQYLPELDTMLPDSLTIPVGEARFVSIDLTAEQSWQKLVRHGADLGLVGRALVGEHGDLSLLGDEVSLTHGRAVIVSYVEVRPQWQGAEYGLDATELVIDELGRCADVAALFPMRPGVDDLAERAVVSSALSRYWSRIGFRDFNGIMIRDLESPPQAPGPRAL